MKRLTLCVVALCVLIHLAGVDTRLLLRYERGWELWRYATGHLVHAGWGHLAVNVIAAFIISLLFRRLTWVALVGSAAGVSAGLYFFSPQVEWYVGLSGVLHGVFAYGAIRAVRAGGRFWLAGLIAMTTKLALEQWRGALPGAANGPVIVDAHLYGAVAGLVLGLLPWPASAPPSPRLRRASKASARQARQA